MRQPGMPSGRDNGFVRVEFQIRVAETLPGAHLVAQRPIDGRAAST
jgi:hypothetical protein